MVKHALFALAAVLSTCPIDAAAHEDCADLMPGPNEAVHRALVAEDLARLRDIGPGDVSGQDRRILALSPDGKHLAFQIQRADPERNTHCLAMVVLDLTAKGAVRVVDRGGEFIRLSFDFMEKAGFPTGMPQMITPRWSPDGTWLAFLKRENGVTQVWRAEADGSGARRLTHIDDDVEEFNFGDAGESLVFETQYLRPERLKIEAESLSGYHYDDRYAPFASARPFPQVPARRAAWTMDLRSGALRAASDRERARLREGGTSQGRWMEARGPHGARAWLDASAPLLAFGSGRLIVNPVRGPAQTCAATACARARQPWWTAAGRVRFVAREGWADASTAIYEWYPGDDSPHRLYVTDDVLADCVPQGDALICLREGSLVPRRLERLDPASGRRSVLFDPNPGFAHLFLGKVKRLHITNSFSLQSVADLVLPVGYRRGQRYPMVVVQYSTRGFLRGGTGDDYPIQAFANRGYAVLSVSKPKAIGLLTATNYEDADRTNLTNFADRRSTLASVEKGVRLAIAKGIADPARVGITGMSDGASTVMFALLHSKLFAAAAMSQCCYDSTLPARVGPAAARNFTYFGYPKIVDRSERAEKFWDEIALSLNARKIRTPILLQLADDEFLSAIVTYTALREVNAPVDMYVFPGEHHIKWQPAHRLAQYRRSLDWFDYWLKGERAQSAARASEISHWDALRRDQSLAKDL